MGLLSSSIPPISDELVAKLESVFKDPVIEPGYDHEAAMYQAGQASVITWIKMHCVASTRSVNGKPQ